MLIILLSRVSSLEYLQDSVSSLISNFKNLSRFTSTVR